MKCVLRILRFLLLSTHCNLIGFAESTRPCPFLLTQEEIPKTKVPKKKVPWRTPPLMTRENPGRKIFGWLFKLILSSLHHHKLQYLCKVCCGIFSLSLEEKSTRGVSIFDKFHSNDCDMEMVGSIHCHLHGLGRWLQMFDVTPPKKWHGTQRIGGLQMVFHFLWGHFQVPY